MPAVLKRVRRLGVNIVRVIPSFEFYSGYSSTSVGFSAFSTQRVSFLTILRSPPLGDPATDGRSR